jgi:hypothetical protein
VIRPAGIVLAIGASLAMVPPGSAQLGPEAPCSVFDGRPCAPSTCSVFDDTLCIPQIPYPFTQDLLLTIQSRADQDHKAPGRPLNTIRELFDALGGCWEPPPLEASRSGTEITIRFSLNRAGRLIGTPRYTYSTPGLPAEVKSVYERAIMAALDRCTPLPLSTSLGGAIAGRPISTRFVDNRNFRTEKAQ